MSDDLIRLLVVLPAFDWLVTAILGLVAYRYPHILTLRERFSAQLVMAVIASIAAYLALVRFDVVVLSNEDALLLLCVALILASVPAVVWLCLLVTGRFSLPPIGGE